MQKRVTVGFGVVLAVLVANTLLSYWNVRRLLANDRRVVHTREVLAALDDFLSLMREAETGQRGFLLTGDETYLAPYREVTAEVDGVPRARRQLDRLRDLAGADPVEAEGIRQLAEESDRKLAETVRLRGQPGGLDAAVAVVRQGRGKQAMDAIRETSAALTARAEARLRARSWEAEAAAGGLRLMLALGALAAIVLLGLAYSLVRRDVALVRRAADLVREQRAWFEVTLLGIGDGVLATDARGRVTLLNPVAEALTGWPQAEAVGRPVAAVFRIVNEQTRQPVEGPVARVIREGVVLGLANHTLLLARDGSERPVDDSGGPIRTADCKVVGAVLVFRDVSERRQREEALREADRRKDEFLAMLAHELRNPLAAVRNALQVLRMPGAGGDLVGRMGAVVERQVKNLVRLVDDLLDVSRISRGKVELRREPVELAAVVERALGSARPFLEERQHRLEVEQPAEALRLEADPVRLEQVLANLLNNAAKYTPPAGRIRVTVGREGDEAVVRVADTGIGIRPEMRARIFDVFQQADRVPGRVAEGLGLGLTLVRRLTELHGGTVEAHSAGPGQGSEFVVRLPLGGDGPRPAPGTAGEPGRAVPAPRRILIVDDNVDSAESLALLLHLDGGHEVRVAHDGPAGLEAVGQFLPEVVLLDIGLPGGMDGYEVARRLRDLPGLESTFLVALTGYGQEEDRRRAEEAGFDAHCVKPADLAVLWDLLGRLSAH